MNEKKSSGIGNLLRQNKRFALFMFLMFVFRSAVADWNSVPTGSMKPTILEGDRILVNKMAYDIRLPFTHIPLIKLDDPKRGDIAIFDSAAADKRLVKRVIGLPGDSVELLNNRLIINGVALDYGPATLAPGHIDLLEDLPGAQHKVRLVRQIGSRLANMPLRTVPAEHYLMMGDNRDNSADSRVIGFVPRKEIIGRTRRVVMSLDYDHYYLPRRERFLKPL